MNILPINYGDLYYEIEINNGKRKFLPCKELKNTQKYLFNFLKTLYKEKYNNSENNKYSYTFKYNISDINNLFSVKSLKRILNKIFVKTKFPSTVDRKGFYKLVTFNGKLAENAITTPLIINIILNIFEDEISEFCLKNEIIYNITNSELVFYSQKDSSNEIKYFLKKLLS